MPIQVWLPPGEKIMGLQSTRRWSAEEQGQRTKRVNTLTERKGKEWGEGTSAQRRPPPFSAPPNAGLLRFPLTYGPNSGGVKSRIALV